MCVCVCVYYMCVELLHGGERFVVKRVRAQKYIIIIIVNFNRLLPKKRK